MRRIPPRWLEVDSGEGLPRIESSKVAASVLANRLGRPVPAFLPRQFTPAVLEQWQANGRQPITIVRDDSGDETKVLAATMIRPLHTVPEATRTAMVAELLRWVRWDRSGTVRDEPAWAAAGLADYDEDPATLSPAAPAQILRRNQRTSADDASGRLA